MTAHVAAGLKTPLALANVTVPVGEEPLTVAVHTVDAPPTTAEGAHATEVPVAVVPAITVMVEEAELPLASVRVNVVGPLETPATVKLTETLPTELVLAVPESEIGTPPKAADTLSEAANPVPITVTTVPCGPLVPGVRVTAGRTVKLALPELIPSDAVSV